MSRRAVVAVRLVVLAAIVIVAFELRFTDLPHLMIGGDENHSIRAALRRSFWRIITETTPGDSAVALTLWAKMLAATVGLSELSLRAPILVAGIGLLFSPLLLARRLGWPAALVAVSLYATSPLLVYYSFVARTYSLAALALLLALVFWDRWAESPTGARLAGFIVCGSLAVVFHLMALFALAGLFLAALVLCWRRALSWRELFKASGLCGLLLSLFYGLAFSSLLENRLDKVGDGERSWAVFSESYEILTGFVPGLVPALGLLACAGIAVLARTRWRLAVATSATVSFATLSIVLLNPFSSSQAWARYQFFTWPIVLLLAAIGLAWIVERIVRRLAPLGSTVSEAAVIAVGLVAAGLLWQLSPIPLFNERGSSLRTARESLLPMREAPTVDEIPSPYRAILADPAAGDTLVEYPLATSWRHWTSYIDYLRVHGKFVKMARLGYPWPEQDGVELRNLVDLLDRDSMSRSGAKYLVVHRNLWRGELGVPKRLLVASHRTLPVGSPTIDRLRQQYGDPVTTDRGVELYDVSRRMSARNLILVTVSSWRADHFLASRGGIPLTPNLVRLARSGVVYSAASSAATSTSPSIAGVMSGLYPWRPGVSHDAHGLPEGLPTLAAVLSDNGFTTMALVASPLLAAGSGFERGFARYELVESETDKPQVTRDLTQRAIRWLASRDADQRFFLWLHYATPHGPYEPPESTLSLFSRDAFPESADVPLASDAGADEGIPRYQQIGTRPSTDAREYAMRYAAEVRFLDRELGRIANLLASAEGDEPLAAALLIVTSDHGEALDDEHGHYFSHGHAPTQDQIHVPLLVRHPGNSRGLISRHPVSTIDVLPTALDMLGIAAPGTLDGFPLMDRGNGLVLSRAPPFAAIRRGDWKLTVGPSGWHQLVNLSQDPDERQDLWNSEVTIGRRLRRELQGLSRRPPLAEPRWRATEPGGEG